MRLDNFDTAGRQVIVQSGRECRSSRIGSRELLLGCLEDPEIVTLTQRHGLDVETAKRELRGPTERDLFGSLGVDIDPAELRTRAQATLENAGRPCMYRRRSRPLHVVLEGRHRTMTFTESGRKVLEVATWRASGARRFVSLRQSRLATPLDLLAGVLCNGHDPTCHLLLDGLREKTLFSEVFPTHTPRNDS